MRNLWPDEDVCFATAQWASGITLREIAAIFGIKGGADVSYRIQAFIHQHYPDEREWCERERWSTANYRRNAKVAIAEFVKQRNARLNA